MTEKIDSKNRQLIHSFDLRYIGQTTEINIPVIWNENNRVFGATVELSQPQVLSSVQQTNISDLKISDLNGETEHIFALEAIMNINVFKVISGDTLKGENVMANLEKIVEDLLKDYTSKELDLK